MLKKKKKENPGSSYNCVPKFSVAAVALLVEEALAAAACVAPGAHPSDCSASASSEEAASSGKTSASSEGAASSGKAGTGSGEEAAEATSAWNTSMTSEAVSWVWGSGLAGPGEGAGAGDAWPTSEPDARAGSSPADPEADASLGQARCDAVRGRDGRSEPSASSSVVVVQAAADARAGAHPARCPEASAPNAWLDSTTRSLADSG